MFDYSKNPFTLNHHDYIDQMVCENDFHNVSSYVDAVFYMSRHVGPIVPYGVIRGYVQWLLAGGSMDDDNPYPINTLAWHHYRLGFLCASENAHKSERNSEDTYHYPMEDYAHG